MLDDSTRFTSLRLVKLAFAAGFALSALGGMTVGCGGGESSGSGGAGGDDTSSSSSGKTSSSTSTTSSASSSTSASSTSTSSSTSASSTSTSATSSSSGQAFHSVTFVVDTTSQADGKQKLAEVKAGEQVFLVGEFNGWNPQDPKYAMTEVANQPGKYSITLQFPLETAGGPIDTGAEFQYKYAKTTDVAGDVWGNGIKDFFTVDATHPCTNAPSEKAGLFELQNLKITIPATDTELPAYVVPAWRDYAQTFGYKTCT